MTIRRINEYKTFVFDCDGVILDSNRTKTLAFYETTVKYGTDLASTFIEYHRVNGGISRYRKFEYFFTDILQREPSPGEMDTLLTEYARYVKQGLLSCKVAEGLLELRKATIDATWLVVSGGDQAELRSVFFLKRTFRIF